MTNNDNSLETFGEDTGKFTQNEAKLWAYLLKLPKHPQVIEHKVIAASFNVSKYKPIFRADAERRFLEVIHQEPRTAATISNLTGITHKYLCLLKAALEEKRLIEVIDFVTCPITNSRNVQLLAPVMP